MPLGYLRRPLFLALVVYMATLAILHGWGVFDAPPPQSLRRFRFAPRVIVLGAIVSPLREDRRGQKVILRAESIAGEACRQDILVFLPRTQDGRALRPGMSVSFEGRLRLPRRPRNPGEFDERRFLWDRGVSWIMHARAFSLQGRPVPLRRRLHAIAETVRRSVQDSFERLLPEDEARILTGLVLGFKGPLRRELKRAVQDAGAMHLLTPSGAKVAFVFLVSFALGMRAGLGPRARCLAAVVIGGFYTLMVGGEPPYMRAYLAGLVLFAGRFLDREADLFQALVVSAVLILAFDPRQLFSVGFQMTYLSVLGLAIALPHVRRGVSRSWPRRTRRVAMVGAITVIVQLMIWPVFAQRFGRGSAVGVLANLLLVPGAGVLMGGGFLLWAVSWLPDPLSTSLAAVLGYGLRVFIWICRYCASWPGAAVNLYPMSPLLIAAYYLAVVALLGAPRRRFAAACLALAGGVWAFSWGAGRLTAPALRVLFLSVPGRPGASLVRFPDGRTWLVDAGAPAGLILDALRAEGVRELEKVVLSSPSSHNRKGLPRILKTIPVGTVETSWSGRTTRLCSGEVCFVFGGAYPRVFKGEAEYSIIPSRLKSRAVEVVTNGRKARVTDPFSTPIHRLRRRFLQ